MADIFWLGRESEQLFDPSLRQPVLCEIVGCERLAGLLRATNQHEERLERQGRTTMDPYCVVQLISGNDNTTASHNLRGSQRRGSSINKALEIHRTASCQDTANPIWTVRTKSLWLLNLPKHKTTAADNDGANDSETNTGNANTNTATRVAIQVWTPEPVQQLLGTVTLTLDEIRAIVEDETNGTGARLEFPIQSPTTTAMEQASSKRETKNENATEMDASNSNNNKSSSTTTAAPAVMALRFRKATKQDQVFLGMIETKSSSDDDDEETNDDNQLLLLSDKQYKPNGGSFDALDVVTMVDQYESQRQESSGFLLSWGSSSRSSSKTDDSSKHHKKQIMARKRKMYQEAADFEFKEVQHKGLFQAYRKKQPHHKNHHKQEQQQDNNNTNEPLYRLLPGPDPHNVAETEWMTNTQLQAEMMKPSQHFVPAGTGTVGKCHVEILSCQDLPNMDLINVNLLGGGNNNTTANNNSNSSSATRASSKNEKGKVSSSGKDHSVDQTDTFVAMVMEDVMVRTDMIWDKLNPKWMPWSMRAFTFHMRHPSSLLMLGVFDYDETPLENHDAIGRVVINVANFQPNTTYVLHYKLHHNPRVTPDDSDRGILTLRLRVEWDNHVEATKASFTPPPSCIINCKTNKTYQILRYLKRGALDMEQSSMDAIKVYAAEIGSYWLRYCHFLDILFEVFLWRGRLKLSPTMSIWFPHHSVALSVAVFTCLEYPRYMGTVLFYGIAWILLTINFHNSQHPYPWKRTKRWVDTNAVLLLGKSTSFPDCIEPNQGLEAGRNRDKVGELRGKRMSNLISSTLSFLYEIYKIYSTTSVSAKFFSTVQRDRFNLTQNLLGSKLSYPHMLFKYLCKYSRVYLRFINWDGYSANSVVLQCLVIATLWLFLPLNYILLWVTRILCWCLLGPWMKLVDMYFVRSWYKTSEELAVMIENGVEDFGPQTPDFENFLQSQWLAQMSRSGRLVAEDALKRKDMRDHVFGSYCEFMPFLDDSRYPSIPLPQSTAAPYVEPSPLGGDLNVKPSPRFVPGQKLKGVMVMTRDSGWDATGVEGKSNSVRNSLRESGTNSSSIFRGVDHDESCDGATAENVLSASHLKTE